MDGDKLIRQGVARRLVPIRGASGRLYGMLDPRTMVIEFRQGKHVERIDLTHYRTEQKPRGDS